MRRHASFISTLIVMICAIIYFALTLRERNLFYFHGEKKVVQDFVEAFRRSHSPLTELNLTSMYGGGGQFQILHPFFAMKSLRLNIQTATCSPEKNEGPVTPQKSLQCEQAPSNLEMSETNLIANAKQQEFIRILRREIVPNHDFILNPPFVDELGRSYADLLSRKDIAPFNDAAWIRGHLSFLKNAELKEIMDRHKIHDLAFATIGQLGDQEIRSMVEGDSSSCRPTISC